MDSVQRLQKINEVLQLDESGKAKAVQAILDAGRYLYIKGKRALRTAKPSIKGIARDIGVNVATYKAMNFLQGGRDSRIGAPGIGGPGAPEGFAQQYGGHTDMPGASPTINWQQRQRRMD